MILLVPSNKGRFWCRLTNVKHADSFRPMKFVRGQAEVIALEALYINRHFPCGLNCINMENRAVAFTQPGNIFDRKHHAGFVVCKRNGYKRLSVRNCILQLLQVECAIGIYFDCSQTRTLTPMLFSGFQNGCMFHCGDNKVPPCSPPSIHAI